MPTSRSPRRTADPPPRSRSILPLLLVGLVAALAVVASALPASIVTHFLPALIHAEDFSGSVWHGSAGSFSVDGRNAGAIEWRLHPATLLRLGIEADVHWVKVGFVLDAAVRVNRGGFSARDIVGGGPVEDLRDFGVPPGWSGAATLNIGEVAGDFDRLQAAQGDLRVEHLSSAQFADGADLGGYDLHCGTNAVDADGNLTAQLQDTGGPIDLQSTLRISAKQRTALLSGSLLERAGVPPALAQQIDGLSQMRGHDARGRIPMDFEFSF